MWSSRAKARVSSLCCLNKKKGRGVVCLHGRLASAARLHQEDRAQTPSLSLRPSFQSDCFQKDNASRQSRTMVQMDGDGKRESARKLHQCSVK